MSLERARIEGSTLMAVVVLVSGDHPLSSKAVIRKEIMMVLVQVEEVAPLLEVWQVRIQKMESIHVEYLLGAMLVLGM